MSNIQHPSIYGYDDAEMGRIYDLLDAYRTQIINAIKATEYPRDLFRNFMHEVHIILNNNELPKEMLDEIRRIVAETIDLLEELSSEREIDAMSSEWVAKLVIEDAKRLSHIILPEAEQAKITVLKVPTEDLQLAEYIPDLFLPDGEVGYKGGVARLALKVYVKQNFPDFDINLLSVELPLSDKDAVFGFGENIWGLAQKMGVNPDGVEIADRFDIEKYLASRDVNMNECMLTRDYLFFTSAALQSVKSGMLKGNDRGRTIFGIDSFYYKKRKYLSNKILHRLVKMVVEGKANGFQLPRYNMDVPLGIYWLVLVRKVIGKKNQAEKIAKIYSCAKQMKQTETKSPLEFIDELMGKYPFFDFISNQSTEDIARWILTKYTTAVHRYMKQKFSIHPIEWPCNSDDDEIVSIKPDIGISSNFIDDYIAKLIAA